MLKRVQIKVGGKVQGVFFRKSTQAYALAHHIKGSVKNQPDGSVYIEAEAEVEALQALLQWCTHGPEAAEVKDVQHKFVDPVGLGSFEVLL